MREDGEEPGFGLDILFRLLQVFGQVLACNFHRDFSVVVRLLKTTVNFAESADTNHVGHLDRVEIDLQRHRLLFNFLVQSVARPNIIRREQADKRRDRAEDSTDPPAFVPTHFLVFAANFDAIARFESQLVHVVRFVIVERSTKQFLWRDLGGASVSRRIILHDKRAEARVDRFRHRIPRDKSRGASAVLLPNFRIILAGRENTLRFLVQHISTFQYESHFLANSPHFEQNTTFRHFFLNFPASLVHNKTSVTWPRRRVIGRSSNLDWLLGISASSPRGVGVGGILRCYCLLCVCVCVCVSLVFKHFELLS